MIMSSKLSNGYFPILNDPTEEQDYPECCEIHECELQNGICPECEEYKKWELKDEDYE